MASSANHMRSRPRMIRSVMRLRKLATTCVNFQSVVLLNPLTSSLPTGQRRGRGRRVDLLLFNLRRHYDRLNLSLGRISSHGCLNNDIISKTHGFETSDIWLQGRWLAEGAFLYGGGFCILEPRYPEVVIKRHISRR